MAIVLFDSAQRWLGSKRNGRFKGKNTVRFCTIAVCAFLTVFPSMARTYTWKASGAVNDWDWTDAQNFEEGAPTDDGTAIVIIPESTTVRLLGTDVSSVALFKTLARVRLSGRWDEAGKTSRLVIDTDSDLESAVPFAGDISFMCGEVIKRGAGTLSLVGTDAGVTTNFYTSLKVEAGTLVLPDSPNDCYFTTFTVASNATLRTVAGGGATCCLGLWGYGTITNTDSHGGREFHINYNKNIPPCVFGGILAHGIRYCSSANVTLTGTNSFAGTSSGAPFTVYGAKSGVSGTNAVVSIGRLNAPSSTGGGHLVYSEYGGTIRYEGIGEETDKNIEIQKPYLDPGVCVFDAGAIGGITFTGAWDINYSASAANHGMGVMEITGSNVVPCVMNGTIPQTIDRNSMTCSLHIVKSGTGTWRFGDDDTRTGATAMTVKEGTLQFDSLDLKGDSCALGTAADTHVAYNGRYDASKATPYAFFMGSPGGDVTFELTGETGAYSIGRLMGLNGNVRFKNDSSAPFRFVGIEPITDGLKILRLSGSNAGENEIAGIEDRTAAPISVVKEGAGVWTLSGSNSFTGKLVVNGGRLNIRSRAGDYTWYRLTIRSTIYNNTGCYPAWLPPLSTDLQYTDFFQMNEWFLIDENHHRQNIGFTACSRLPELKPGQIGYFGRFAVMGYNGVSSYTPPSLLCDAQSNSVGLQVRRKNTSAPRPDDPSTWLSFVLRLTNGTPRIVSYDFVNFRGTNSISSGESIIGSTVGSYVLDGSLDGLAWDRIAENSNTMDPTGNIRVQKNGNCIMSAGRSYTNRTGADVVWETSPSITCFTTSSGSALDTVSSVTVASNATLAGIGDGVVIPSIEVDLASGGAISNCGFSASGTINVVGTLPTDAAHLPLSFMDVRNLQNVNGWMLYINGSRTASRKLVVRNGGIDMLPIGSVLHFR